SATGPDLLPVDHVFLAVAARGRTQRRQVRSRSRLGIALAPDDVTAQHRPQPPPLLLLGAVLDDGGRDDAEAGAERTGDSGPGDLLLVDDLPAEGQVHATVFARPGR